MAFFEPVADIQWGSVMILYHQNGILTLSITVEEQNVGEDSEYIYTQ